MARFKKKKSKPTEGSDDSKKKSVKEGSDDSKKKSVKEETNDIPEIENESTTPEVPSGEPPVSEAEQSEKDKKLNKLFWMRVALAVIAGTAATFIFEDIEGEDRRWASIGFMIIIFFATIIVAKGMKMQLPSSDRKKIVTQAIGSYIFLYLFTWIVTYTLVNSGSVSSGINL